MPASYEAFKIIPAYYQWSREISRAMIDHDLFFRGCLHNNTKKYMRNGAELTKLGVGKR